MSETGSLNLESLAAPSAPYAYIAGCAKETREASWSVRAVPGVTERGVIERGDTEVRPAAFAGPEREGLGLRAASALKTGYVRGRAPTPGPG